MITHVHLTPPQEGKLWQSEFTTLTFSVDGAPEAEK